MSNHDKKIDILEEQIVSCNGEGSDVDYTEHPEIYLTIKNGQEVVCPYCSKIFTYNI
ncbi:zinc-finger domain-containing protein [Ehrlichia ruminantium]|uniref:Zinc finger CHCC-type domain-containing protein n=2 Tax=Ehrlichia ruminantium TaxID=779 RepID=A0A170S8R0_EHRRU|nr:zinc-finger domain-containing protein [Ehrlichia ruminantium]GAT77754.1 hypothetical protein EHRUM2_09850 [Ehrlichia ruminantium]GAT78941.1 hypothetical protein EHRUM3_11750 [Ehrlichia ruminantium]